MARTRRHDAFPPGLLTRRDLLKGAAVLAAGAASARAARAATEGGASGRMKQQPNIVLAIADDWSWPHAGVYGDPVARTPTFDRLARGGMLFRNAFCSAPTCTASRGAILTGQEPHRLEEGGNLWSLLRPEFITYPDILEEQGYFVGFSRKGWGPGDVPGSGRNRNPAGSQYPDFGEFLKARPEGQPFCYWFGSTQPHRPYKKGSGADAGYDLSQTKPPPFLPDTPEIRADLADYYAEVETFDSQVGDLLKTLDEQGLAENTLVIMTSDNGMPFPRAKANLYECGVHMPMAVRWPGQVRPGSVTSELIGFVDVAPTLLEAAGEPAPREMTGRSFLDVLQTGRSQRPRETVFTERERHAFVRRGNLSYPSRSVRTRQFLYIRNYRPDRWPAGDPDAFNDMGAFGDIDGSPTKEYLLQHRDDPATVDFFSLATAKRPAEELYNLSNDPWCMKNVAGEGAFSGVLATMSSLLDRWMRRTGDPRALSDEDPWDSYPYTNQKHSTTEQAQKGTAEAP